MSSVKNPTQSLTLWLNQSITEEWQHPTGRKPGLVELVALGPTSRYWVQHRLKKNEDPTETADEVWTLNRGIRSFKHDLAFIMDDLDSEAAKDPDYGEAIANHDQPIIASTLPETMTHDSFWPYPLTHVLNKVGTHHAYFHNSVPYILAYAILIGVQEIHLYGCDYTHDEIDTREAGRANCEYWVGVARSHGMIVGVPTTSTLLDSNQSAWFYGYADQRLAKDLFSHSVGAIRG